MGARVRLKANVDIGYLSPINQAIARTLKKYGMILADNGGDWFIQGVPDRRWAEVIYRCQPVPKTPLSGSIRAAGWKISNTMVPGVYDSRNTDYGTVERVVRHAGGVDERAAQ